MIRISAAAFFCGALIFLVVPLEWVLSVFLAAFFHEVCHCIMIYVCGGKILAIDIKTDGAVIEANIPGMGKELLCSAAGPAGSLMLLVLYRCMPKVAFCGFIQGMANLMPFYPLDGGRILRCILELAQISGIQRIVRRVEWLSRFVFIGVFLLLLRHCLAEGLPKAIGTCWILSRILRKRPCKASQIKVQ